MLNVGASKLLWVLQSVQHYVQMGKCSPGIPSLRAASTCEMLTMLEWPLQLFWKMQQKELQHPLSPLLCCWMHNASAVWDVLIEQMNQSGYQSATTVQRSLINMYCKCGSNLGSLEGVNGIATHDVVTWNAMIQGYSVKCEEGWKMLKLSQQMKHGTCAGGACQFFPLV